MINRMIERKMKNAAINEMLNKCVLYFHYPDCMEKYGLDYDKRFKGVCSELKVLLKEANPGIKDSEIKKYEKMLNKKIEKSLRR